MDFDDILATSIERMALGKSVESCLALFPEYAEELEPLLRAMASLQAEEKPALSSTAFTRGREAMAQALETNKDFALVAAPADSAMTLVEKPAIPKQFQSQKPVKRSFAWPTLAGTAVAASLLVVVLFGVSQTPQVMPGSGIYWAKALGEQGQGYIMTATGNEAEWHARLASRRLSELQALQASGQPITPFIIQPLLDEIENAHAASSALSSDEQTRLENELLAKLELAKRTLVIAGPAVTLLEQSQADLAGTTKPDAVAIAAPQETPTPTAEAEPLVQAQSTPDETETAPTVTAATDAQVTTPATVESVPTLDFDAPDDAVAVAPPEPSTIPVEIPTAAPTSAPTEAPTQAPADTPTSAPTIAETAAPTEAPPIEQPPTPVQPTATWTSEPPTPAPTAPAQPEPTSTSPPALALHPEKEETRESLALETEPVAQPGESAPAESDIAHAEVAEEDAGDAVSDNIVEASPAEPTAASIDAIASAGSENQALFLLPTTTPATTSTVTPTVSILDLLPTTTPTKVAPPPTQTPTAVTTPAATATPIPTLVPTVAPTVAPSDTPTIAPTSARTAAPTLNPTHTAVATSTVAPTNTVAPTYTPPPTATQGPTATATPAPTSTPTVVPATATPSQTPSPTPTLIGGRQQGRPVLLPSTTPDRMNAP